MKQSVKYVDDCAQNWPVEIKLEIQTTCFIPVAEILKPERLSTAFDEERARAQRLWMDFSSY